ncbi:hypothetical protein PZA11_007244 [Diplocarpon coronariae]
MLIPPSRERNSPGSIGPSISRRVMVLKFPAVILLLCLPRLSWARPTWHSPTCYPDLLSAGAEELVAGLESGAWSSVDLTRAYILRIHEVNDLLHVVTEINPDALTIAEALDAERANGTTRSALHGIPMLIKNNIATKDRMNNTAGSFALLGAAVPRDATVAGKLRAAGVILLGKSNLSQWANFRSSNSSSGWSADGNQTTSAYHPNADPSGSSSGSGVGTSIGLAFASLGTETDGSILSPSSANNLVGIKPSVGLTSRSLVIPISSHQDTVGRCGPASPAETDTRRSDGAERVRRGAYPLHHRGKRSSGQLHVRSAVGLASRLLGLPELLQLSRSEDWSPSAGIDILRRRHQPATRRGLRRRAQGHRAGGRDDRGRRQLPSMARCCAIRSLRH